MPRLCFITEFDGTSFAGFQSQENGRAVQDVLESALCELFKEKIRLTGCSRTDAGVHAKCHLSHADVPFVIPEEKFPLAMNALLPDDVAVKRAFYAKDDFSARFSINGKRYIYRIYVSPTRDPFLDRYAYYCPVMPDVEAMKEASKAFAGEHDFRAFCAAGGSQKTYVRRLHNVSVRTSGSDPLVIEIEVSGEAFLYNMVRIIAGTLLYVGQGKIPADSIGEVIEKGDRSLAGKTLAAKGLTLEEVYFDEGSARQE
ncbi:MAG: tRNA pseudouridine(38-40) synthase TruA [Clostridiales bacterium]|jgi:tRNA pseudouridine38-40 synthase|nr:tRNA pseudouridine(38-40) synthase TruA [Clostridiales bacterium]